MYIYRNGLESMHIELTNKCNARCPQCSRTNNQQIEDSQVEITLKQFKQYFNAEFIQRLKKIKFCGNFGDPAMARDCVPIHQYIIECNPNIDLTFDTNGGIRTTTFWKELGKFYVGKPESFLIFHIDGMEDTNHIYRADVSYSNVMKNAKAAISTGAQVVWAFIPFMHNEHQVEDAEELSKKMGFYKFAVKISSRFEHKLQPFSYKDAKTGITKQIFPATSPEFNVSELLANLDKPVCTAEKRKEIYVDARGRLLPCCWYGSGYETNETFRHAVDKQHTPDLNKTTVDAALDTPLFRNIKDTWDTSDDILNKPCYKKCSGKLMHFWRIDGTITPQKNYAEWLREEL
jgi:MoaA/NifB/PqqE/SkfB family radical SAM enzyme